VARYEHLITPGHVLRRLFALLSSNQHTCKSLLQISVPTQLLTSQQTRLGEAGSDADHSPGIHKLFVDLPYSSPSASESYRGHVSKDITAAMAKNHKFDPALDHSWGKWSSLSIRARGWFLKGGPGQGKSTVSQYFSQVHRAALLLAFPGLHSGEDAHKLALEIKEVAIAREEWPASPRFPLYVSLREYAQWSVSRTQNRAEMLGLLTYIAESLSKIGQQTVTVQDIRTLVESTPILVMLDGLDEVPSDSRQEVGNQVTLLLDELHGSSDCFTICSSRPQGYGGEFDRLSGIAPIQLEQLEPERAVECASRLVEATRPEYAENARRLLEAAIKSNSVAQLMTTPLQCHIIAVIVRNGSTPPDRKYELYSKYYDVMFSRESSRPQQAEFADLFRREPQLLKAVHEYAGFRIHVAAEASKGASASLTVSEFEAIVREIVACNKDEEDVGSLVRLVMRASSERLVLLSTPDEKNLYRFDVRQLQEFFAAEYIYRNVPHAVLDQRIQKIAHDSHWREVIHFLLSAFVEQSRVNELSMAIVTLRLEYNSNSETPNLSRVMAVGGAHATALAMDGVLENDRRMRERFTDLIKSLSTSAVGRVHVEVSKVGGHATRRWLVSCFLNELERENADGAVAVLWNLLHEPDDVQKVVHYIGRYPDTMLTLVRLHDFGFHFNHDWHVDAFLTAIAGASADIASQLLYSWRNVLVLERRTMTSRPMTTLKSKVRSMLGTSAWYMFELYGYETDIPVGSGLDSPKIIAFPRFAIHHASTAPKWVEERITKAVDASGSIGALARIFMKNIETIPVSVKLPSLLQRETQVVFAHRASRARVKVLEDMRTLWASDPKAAFKVWSGLASNTASFEYLDRLGDPGNAYEYVDYGKIVSGLVDLAVGSYRTSLVDPTHFPVSTWSLVRNTLGEAGFEDFCTRIKPSALGSIRSPYDDFTLPETAVPLKLPRDGEMLILIAEMFVVNANRFSSFDRNDVSPRAQSARVQELVNVYANIEELENVVLNSVEPRVRSAALALIVAHPKFIIPARELLEIAHELSRLVGELAMLVASMIEVSGRFRHGGAMVLLDACLDRPSQSRLSRFVDRWREISSAPISNQLLEPIWSLSASG
jgi:hypothetical protein